jgi:PAS domain S-box-containing protein
MKHTISKLEKNIVFYVLIGIFAFIVITVILLFIDAKKTQQEVESFYLKQIDRSIKLELKHFLQDYSKRVEHLFETTDIVKFIQNKDRETLYKLLKPKFDLLRKVDPNILLMHIHLKNGESFLRVHKPKIYGDMISDKRGMLREIHKNHKMISGYETGIFALAYRVIMPIFAKDKTYIGAFELGVDPNFVVDSIHMINGFQGAVFIKQNKLKIYSNYKLQSNNITIDGYKLQSNLTQDIEEVCKRLKTLTGNSIVKVNDQRYLVYALNLKNFKGEDSVKILFFQNITIVENFLNNSICKLYLLIFTIFIVFAFLIYHRIAIFQGKIHSIYNRKIEKLQASEIILLKQQFEQFMEFIPANILIKEDGRIIYANSSATNSLTQEESILGKTIDELFAPDVATKLKKLEEDAFKYDSSEMILELLDDKNKKSIYRNMVFVIKTKKKNRLGVVSIDITKEYQANRKIEKVLSAFQRSNISVIMTDVFGNIEYVNTSWCKITGYCESELIGKNPKIVKSDFTSKETYEKMWQRLTKGKVWNGEFKNIAKDGTEFWEDSTIIPSFDRDGKVNGYIAFKLEIGEKIKLRQELKNKEEIMIAQSRHAAMGEMISMIAHQWRQPISVISMDANNILVDIELDMLDKNDLKAMSEDIIFQTQELSKTIDDFREFFKPNKNPEQILLKEILDDALGVIATSLQNHNIDIVLEIDESIEIKTFSRELMQVMINIIKNAKEVLVEKEQTDKYIKIKFYKSDKYINLDFIDNGGGIKNDVIGKIFDPYFTTKGDKNGTGLGLYISKTIVEKHLHGKIKVTNQDNGAYFKIELPYDLNNFTDNTNYD